MSDLDELYQSVILDHDRAPRNFRVIEGAHCREAEGNNPLCGDRFRVMLKVENGVVTDAGFQGSGCAISKASASLMTAAVKGKSRADAMALADEFQKLVTGRLEGAAERKALGKLQALAGVSEYPVRVKCASLAWHTLKAALAGAGEPISTE